MAKLKTLEDFFIEELKDLYSAEKQITKALPKMVKAASSEELKEAFQNHLGETENQVKRLEKISQILGRGLTGKKCAAMEGLLEEGKELMEEDAAPEVMDAALIAAAQKVEHYEISAYGSLVTLAKTMGQDEVAEILSQTLEEEKETDELLTQLAESSINWQAEEEGEEGEESEEDEEEEEEEEK